YPIELEYQRSEMQPQFANVATPGEIVVATSFQLEIGEIAGAIHFCLPYATLEPIREVLYSSTQGDVSGIESLKWMDAPSVAELLRSEHPQIVAAILVHLEFDQAADVLKLLSERQRNEVMLRIATMEGIQPTALKDLNEVLFQMLAGADRVRKSSLGGVKTAAEMINLMGNAIEGTVIEAIRNHDPDLAQKIMDKMFAFDDLSALDNKSIRMVLKEVASDTLIAVLKDAQTELKEKILSNMSSRAAETLREDMESRGPMRLSDVEAQQKEVLKIVRRLADEGQIVVGGGGDEAMA
ncbi:MAG: flagellar motor switch protein FliG, partial [Burkholderiaceae bacterium]